MTKIRGARHKIKKLEKPSEINKFFRNINEIIKNIHSDSANNIREEIEKGIFYRELHLSKIAKFHTNSMLIN